jgi:1-hydroxy-2-naphthoate dioxygenase
MDDANPASVAALDDKLARIGIEGYWKLVGVNNPEPKPRGEPFLWRWQDVRPLLFEASGAVALGADAERRSLRLCPPGPAVKATTDVITSAIQMMLPGEVAPAHRHSPAALRFVIEGPGGGHTTVNGERCEMAPADLILTPQGCWHDHGNLGAEPTIWLDVLDASLLGRLNAHFFEPHNSATQAVSRPPGTARRLAGTLRAKGFAAQRAGFPYHYKGQDSLALLSETDENDPCDGATLDFVNPVDGGPTMPTIQCSLSRLKAGRTMRAHRHTWNAVCHVVQGSGETEAGGKTLRWGPHDTFVIPSWTWHAHRAAPGGDAVLFCATDEPVLKAFALDRVDLRN